MVETDPTNDEPKIFEFHHGGVFSKDTEFVYKDGKTQYVGDKEDIQKGKAKKMFLTPTEIEDLLQAGYVIDEAFHGKEFQIVEPIDSEEDDKKSNSENINEENMDEELNESGKTSKKVEVKNENVGFEEVADMNIEDRVTEAEEYESDEERTNLNEENDVPDWLRYKPMHEADDEFCVEEDGRFGYDKANCGSFASRDVASTEIVAYNTEFVHQRKGKEHVHEEELFDEHANEELVLSGDEKLGKEDWTKPVIESEDSDCKDVSGRRNVKVWEDYADARDVKIGLYSRFKNAKVFRGVLKLYAAENRFDYIFTKNEPKQIGVVCKEDKCDFYIWCTAMQNSSDLEIKTFYPEHNCEGVLDNSKITSDWLGERYMNEIRDDPNMDTVTFAKKIYSDWEVYVSDYKLYRAIKRAKTLIAGDTTVQYSKLYDYLNMVSKTNPDSKWKVEVEHHAVVGEEQTTPRFLRLYLRFGPEKKGFTDACRPFIGIEVDDGSNTYTVNLGGKKCSCLEWQLNGIPCKHVVPVILKNKHKLEDYVSQYYYVDTFKRQYDGKIFPVPGMNDWEPTNHIRIQPPIVQKPPGRPRVRRRKNPAESTTANPYKASKKGVEMTCGRCNKKGHNVRSCTSKDYGETSSQRKKRKMENNQDGGSSVPAGGNSGAHTTGIKVDVQEKRLRAKKKMAMRRKAFKEGVSETQVQASVSAHGAPPQCTPKQIEAKRQAALDRQHAKQGQNDKQQCEDWIIGVHRPKRQKLQIIRKELKKSTQTKQAASETRHTIPAEGLAQQLLNAQTITEKHFTKLNEKADGSVAGGSVSRFAREARFTRSARSAQVDGSEALNTQPTLKATVASSKARAHSSQP